MIETVFEVAELYVEGLGTDYEKFSCHHSSFSEN